MIEKLQDELEKSKFDFSELASDLADWINQNPQVEISQSENLSQISQNLSQIIQNLSQISQKSAPENECCVCSKGKTKT